MESDKQIIRDIQVIRSKANFNTMSFLNLLYELDYKLAKNYLNKIQNGDKEVQILSDLLHMEKSRSDLDILNEIESIRVKNNTLWMDVVRLCFELDATKARKIFSQIKEYDKQIHILSKEIANNEKN